LKEASRLLGVTIRMIQRRDKKGVVRKLVEQLGKTIRWWLNLRVGERLSLEKLFKLLRGET